MGDLLGVAVAPPDWVNLRVDGSQEPRPPRRLDVALPAECTLAEATHLLVRTLLLRQAEVTRRENDPPVEGLDWMAAAITHGIVHCSRRFLARPVPDYEPARDLFRSGRFPKVSQLFGLPVGPDHHDAYQLYALHCHLLAAVIESTCRRQKPVFHRILELEARGRSVVDAVTFVVHDSFEAGEDLQSWYERLAPRVGRCGRRAQLASQVAERLADLRTVRVIAVDGVEFGSVAVHLDKLPGYLKSGAIDEEVLVTLEYQFYELLKDSPTLLQEPLIEYVKAVQMLAQRKFFSGKRRLAQARRAFERAFARQRDIETAMDKWEGHLLSSEQQFPLYLETIRRNRARRAALDPQLQQCLDGYEAGTMGSTEAR